MRLSDSNPLGSAKGPVKLVVLYSPQVLENMERRFEELRLSRKQQRWISTLTPKLSKRTTTTTTNT